MALSRSRNTHLQKEIVYGLVDSRRLGPSLGLNLFPGTKKVCSFDCIYCFFETPSHKVGDASPATREDVVRALDSNRRLVHKCQYLTFSGNGEPTLHPDFPAIVSDVAKKAQDFGRPLAIFTNGTQLSNPDVVSALKKFSKVFVKLDCGTDLELRTVARPHDKNMSVSGLAQSIRQFVTAARTATAGQRSSCKRQSTPGEPRTRLGKLG